jgi:3-hydroxybutyrate dehydrogenase
MDKPGSGNSKLGHERALEGRVVLVTGSTQGIGAGIAWELASAGAATALHGLGDLEEIERMRREMESSCQTHVAYFSGDLSNENECRALVRKVLARFERIDILVNNAGIQHVADIEKTTVASWNRVLAVNLSAAFHLVAEALPSMRRNGFGRIVNIASVHGLVASPRKAAYVAAKHGLIGLTKVTALETAGSGVTCNAVCPGWVLTPLVQEQIDARARENEISIERAESELLSEKQPSGSFSTPEQIGAMVKFLCSDAASNITGSSITIDGGWTAQ